MQWQIDVKLRHKLHVRCGDAIVSLDEIEAGKVTKIIGSIDDDNDKIRCANCNNAELDDVANALQCCHDSGCPGCFHCGRWIDEDELRDRCHRCIIENYGVVDEDFCYRRCPHYDFGLGEVRQHYGISLEELIHDAGF